MTAATFNHPYLTLGLLIAFSAITLFFTMRLQREVAEDATPTTPKEVFGPLERAYHAGLMHEAEYLRIRDQMAQASAAAQAKPPADKKAGPPVDEWASWDVPGGQRAGGPGHRGIPGLDEPEQPSTPGDLAPGASTDDPCSL